MSQWNSVFLICEFVGLEEYDPDGRKARILERAIGIKVIRHSKLNLVFGILFCGTLLCIVCAISIVIPATRRISLILLSMQLLSNKN